MATYTERAEQVGNAAAQKLLRLMDEKQSNLSIALDVTTTAEFLAVLEKVAPYICLLKTHIDVIDDFSAEFIARVQELAAEHNFMIFEDRKFADIGNTVKKQYADGVYHIADWADFVNAHIVPGPGIIEGLREVGMPKGRGLMLLAEMSSLGALATGEYTKTAYEWAAQYNDFVMGFIGKGSADIPESMLVMTPGIKLESGGDGLGQQYQTPQMAIEAGTDVIIVGRGIYEAGDVAATAKLYQDAGWNAYKKRCSA